MTQMTAAAAAMGFGADHAVAGVGGGFHRIRHGRIEAGPAGAAFIFGAGFEQFRAAAGTEEFARPLLIIQRTGAGAFGAVLAQHAILLGRQGILPLAVAFMHFAVGHFGLPMLLGTAFSWCFR